VGIRVYLVDADSHLLGRREYSPTSDGVAASQPLADVPICGGAS